MLLSSHDNPSEGCLILISLKRWRECYLISQGHTVLVWELELKTRLRPKGLSFSSHCLGAHLLLSQLLKYREECFKLLDELNLWEVRKMPDNSQGQRTTVLKSEKKNLKKGGNGGREGWRSREERKGGREIFDELVKIFFFFFGHWMCVYLDAFT